MASATTIQWALASSSGDVSAELIDASGFTGAFGTAEPHFTGWVELRCISEERLAMLSPMRTRIRMIVIGCLASSNNYCIIDGFVHFAIATWQTTWHNENHGEYVHLHQVYLRRLSLNFLVQFRVVLC